ncbi:MAG: tRNA(fMet)-specific endonuclease VapC [Methanosaeta sp. PtaU1.Bin112]|nr:MAG: tRNA(fMet)-specific endonuclease VapC [Methanosaeta sp. PtaU1.Bin112]
MIVLDTAFIVDLLRGRQKAQEMLSRLEDGNESVCTTSINVLELYRGVFLSKKIDENLRMLSAMLDQLLVLDLNEDAYEIFGALSAWLRSSGRPVGDLDEAIAAIALAYGAGVVSRDRHFLLLPGLRVVEY